MLKCIWFLRYCDAFVRTYILHGIRKSLTWFAIHRNKKISHQFINLLLWIEQMEMYLFPRKCIWSMQCVYGLWRDAIFRNWLLIDCENKDSWKRKTENGKPLFRIESNRNESVKLKHQSWMRENHWNVRKRGAQINFLFRIINISFYFELTVSWHPTSCLNRIQ